METHTPRQGITNKKKNWKNKHQKGKKEEQKKKTYYKIQEGIFPKAP